MPSSSLASLIPRRAVALWLCFTERGLKPKMISEEEITRCWKVSSREKTARSTVMKVRWKRNSLRESTSWCAINTPASRPHMTASAAGGTRRQPEPLTVQKDVNGALGTQRRSVEEDYRTVNKNRCAAGFLPPVSVARATVSAREF